MLRKHHKDTAKVDVGRKAIKLFITLPANKKQKLFFIQLNLDKNLIEEEILGR